MLLDLVQPFLRATVSLELAEISIPRCRFYYITPCTICIFHRSVIDCTFIARTEDLYVHTFYTSSFILIMLLDLVQSFLRATVSHEFTEVSIASMHSCLYDLDFSHVRLRLYLYCTDGWLVFLNSSHL